jgi:hypothetical protein
VSQYRERQPIAPVHYLEQQAAVAAVLVLGGQDPQIRSESDTAIVGGESIDIAGSIPGAGFSENIAASDWFLNDQPLSMVGFHAIPWPLRIDCSQHGVCMKGVVIDTNVFVAAGFNRRSAAARIVAAVREGHFQLVWNKPTDVRPRQSCAGFRARMGDGHGSVPPRG